MTAPTSYNAASMPDGGGVHLASCGSDLFIVNSDAKTLTNSGTDPWAVIAGAHASHGDCYLIDVPNDGLYLDLHALWDDTTGDLGTNPKVRVFGKTHKSHEPLRPGVVDSTNYGNPDDMWVPLSDSDGATEIELDGDLSEGCLYGTAPTFAIGKRSTVYLSGCKQVLVTISTAGVDGGTVMAGGRFVS